MPPQPVRFLAPGGEENDRRLHRGFCFAARELYRIVFSAKAVKMERKMDDLP